MIVSRVNNHAQLSPVIFLSLPEVVEIYGYFTPATKQTSKRPSARYCAGRFRE